METRIAGPLDVDAVTETIALAFRDDPVWGPALSAPDGGTDHLAAFWRFFVEGAIPHRNVFLQEGPAGEAATVAVWLPPGVDELTGEQETQVDALMERTLTPERFAAYQRLWERVRASRIRTPRRTCTSACWRRIPSTGVAGSVSAPRRERWNGSMPTGLPAYLESTNPANDHRYERAGFRPVGRVPFGARRRGRHDHVA